MSDEILKRAGEDLKEIEPRIKDVENLVKALKEAGENTVPLESKLRDLQNRRNKWVNMLKNRNLY